MMETRPYRTYMENAMKKNLIVVCICMITALSCQIPQSITVKGKPGLYIPVGSPFELLDEGARLENYISPQKIREMMGDSKSDGVKIYEYEGPDVGADVQAYVIHYPIIRMQLDLTEYMEEAMENAETDFSLDIPDINTVTVPGLPANPDDLFNPPNGYFKDGCFITGEGKLEKAEDTPLFTIDLAEMRKLLKVATGDADAFGIELDLEGTTNYEEHLWVKIPALFGTDAYKKGTKQGNTLRFTNENPVTFKPTDLKNDKLEIYVKMTRPCSGLIEPKVIMDWKTAEIYADNKDLSDEYTIENMLGEFLGSGVSFKTVKGYMYVGGVGDSASLTLTMQGQGNTVPLASGKLADRKQPQFSDPIKVNLPSHSLVEPFIDLKSVLNASGSTKLKYGIEIETIKLTNNDADKDLVIFADLVVLLPLELEIRGSISGEPNYVKLEMSDVFPEPKDGDIFGRTGKDSDIFNYLDYVKITLKDIKNDIIDPSILSILVTNTNQGGTYKKSINFDTEDPYLKIEMNDLPFPFSPKFEILLKKDTNKDYATLKIKRPKPGTPAEFDFFLTIEAKANIDHEISLW